MTVTTLASGSSGNAILVSHGQTHLLVDCGISCLRVKRALAALGLSAADLTGILITHEHSEHISGLETLFKQFHLPVYCSGGTARQLSYRIAGIEGQLHPFAPCSVQDVGSLRMTVFSLSHDASDGTGYRFDCGEGSVGVITDTGYIMEQAHEILLGSDLLLLEANHDVESVRSGPYPYFLKERILGACGHLSNDAAAYFACETAAQGTKQIVLAHLSSENNTPGMAMNTVGRKLEAAGYTGRLTVAPRSSASQLFEIHTASSCCGGLP